MTVYRHPTSVVASPDTMFVNQLTQPGEFAGQFTAAMYDRNGYVIEGGWLLFESLESQIASVSIEGHVSAHQNGEARIVAISFSGVHDTVLVIVNAPPPSPEPVDWSLVPTNDDVDVFARASRFDRFGCHPRARGEPASRS